MISKTWQTLTAILLFSFLIGVFPCTDSNIIALAASEEANIAAATTTISQLEEAQRAAAMESAEANRAAAIETETKRLKYESVYRKLADGMDINLLIVGDSIGAGSGASDDEHKWANILKAGLEEEYGVAVNMTNVSMGGNASYAGYVRTMELAASADKTGKDSVSRELADGVPASGEFTAREDFDLAILCYGHNDSKKNFSLFYESIIHALKISYPRISIICIQESSQKEYTEKMQAISMIAEHYGLPVVDTIAPFQDDYQNLVSDHIHPNDAGQEIYYECVKCLIDSRVSQRQGHDPSGIAVIDERMDIFDSFRYYPPELFEREGNTLTLYTQDAGTILGMDFKMTPGLNSCRVIIDGEEYSTAQFNFKQDYKQRHIKVINGWPEGSSFEIKKAISIEFTDDADGKYRADNFAGLMISG
ncbi:SGNH/GDSL hydrolase family protein [Butyrivibrio sp. MC2013]|uniref:SGNH/GDSL hydrolase family protein n=1 Tax=Butyrivibrio sp. MC2013 TaxID=1280686 RepID=UPI00047CDF85|nr:SGNH/GDSL hydrolase family protein [Butyrivibrio sp. MC2013]